MKIEDSDKDPNTNLSDNKSSFRYLCLSNDLAVGRSRKFSIRDERDKEIEIAVFNINGKYYAISNTCQHQNGPLSEGIIDSEKKIVTCPWHGWKYSVIDGKAPHKGGDSVNSYQVKVVEDKLYVDSIPTNVGKRVTQPHQAYSSLDNSVKEFLNHMDNDTRLEVRGERGCEGGDANVDNEVRVLGISTTNSNDKVAPRNSTSEAAISYALDYAKNEFGAETLMIKLRDLHFKHCEGYYSKNAKACIFPCSISEMDKDDQMTVIYEKVILGQMLLL